MRYLLPLALSFLVTSVHAAPKPDQEEDIVLRPVVSPKGIKRIYDNIELAQSNIKETQANIAACEKNRVIVIAELQELDKLEREQVDLVKSYEAYLQNARTRTQKNDDDLKELIKYEKDNKNKLTGNTGQSQLELAGKLNTSRQEIQNRRRWREDADAKVIRIQKLLEGSRENLRDIERRRATFKAQLAGWASREAGFKKLIQQYAMKKTELERLAQTLKKELPADVTAESP